MRKLLAIVLALVTLLSMAGCQEEAPQTVPTQPPATEPSATKPSEGEHIRYAPDFTVYDRDGNPVKLSDFRGKPVILNFWASKCPPCRSEMPDFQAAYEEYADQIHFVMVNLTDGAWDTTDSAAAFIDGSGYTFPIYFDTDGDATGTYGISSIPTTYFIHANGGLVAYFTGMLDMDLLKTGISMIQQ